SRWRPRPSRTERRDAGPRARWRAGRTRSPPGRARRGRGRGRAARTPPGRTRPRGHRGRTRWPGSRSCPDRGPAPRGSPLVLAAIVSRDQELRGLSLELVVVALRSAVAEVREPLPPVHATQPALRPGRL